MRKLSLFYLLSSIVYPFSIVICLIGTLYSVFIIIEDSYSAEQKWSKFLIVGLNALSLLLSLVYLISTIIVFVLNLKRLNTINDLTSRLSRSANLCSSSINSRALNPSQLNLEIGTNTTNANDTINELRIVTNDEIRNLSFIYSTPPSVIITPASPIIDSKSAISLKNI